MPRLRVFAASDWARRVTAAAINMSAGSEIVG
jgi:hypothetical protein